jgi:hypothetical protein
MAILLLCGAKKWSSDKEVLSIDTNLMSEKAFNNQWLYKYSIKNF